MSVQQVSIHTQQQQQQQQPPPGQQQQQQQLTNVEATSGQTTTSLFLQTNSIGGQGQPQAGYFLVQQQPQQHQSNSNNQVSFVCLFSKDFKKLLYLLEELLFVRTIILELFNISNYFSFNNFNFFNIFEL